jgi:nicotinamidase-related amidase/glutathione S-transferase
MFSFDQASLPQITTRKALIGIDFQYDFISKDGALPVHEPEGFVDRTIKLAQAFRDVGDVVWVQSQFSETRYTPEEHIVITDNVPKPPRGPTRGRPKAPVKAMEVSGPPDKEAFLSHEEAVCVKVDTPGCRMAPTIEDSLPKTDARLTKSHYSAFQSTHLLRVLRAKMVMELFICGSLANVGVYATALDAAGHGMAITIVDDCCGYLTESRKTAAIASLIELTGCEIASYDEVMEVIQPKPKAKLKPPKSKDVKKPSSSSKDLEQNGTVKSESTEDKGREKSTTPDFVKDMTSLRLASDSLSPAPASTQPQPKAPSTSAAEDHDLKVKTQSKSEETHSADQATSSQPPGEAQERNETKAPPINDDVVKAIEVKTEPVPSPNTSKDEVQTPNMPLQESTTKNDDQAVELPPLAETMIAEVQPVQSPCQNTPEMEELAKKAPQNDEQKKPKTKKPAATDERSYQQRALCEGDTDVIEDVLPDSLLNGIFDKLRDEVQWKRMSHQGGQVPRLVAVQGEVGPDGNIPVYRHPSDESPPLLPFSQTVKAIKTKTEKHLGHPLNHVLIQYYRDGNDHISEHSDKTLDIVKGSYIANVSLGAERTMTFRTKRRDKDSSQDGVSSPEGPKRTIQRAKLPHNSLCRLSLQSNMKWLHAIRQDKRSKKEKSPAELAYEGGRISLTFRRIGTFLNREETLIWGQGAKAKTFEDAHPVINGQTPEAIEMLKAFGTENNSSEFHWDEHYGKGFDVLHISNAPRFFACSDPTINMRIALMLAELGVNYAKGSVTAGSESLNSENLVVKFTDKDKSTVQGDFAVMLYLDARYGPDHAGDATQAPKDLATRLTRFQRAVALLGTWRTLSKDSTSGKRDLMTLKHELEVWNGFVAEDNGSFITGAELSLPDFALWPVLHDMIKETGMENFGGLKELQEYYEKIEGRASVKKVLGKE